MAEDLRQPLLGRDGVVPDEIDPHDDSKLTFTAKSSEDAPSMVKAAPKAILKTCGDALLGVARSGRRPASSGLWP